MERVFFCPVHPSVYQWSIVADQAAEHTTATFRPPELFDVKTGISLDERVDIWVRRFPTPFFCVCVCVVSSVAHLFFASRCQCRFNQGLGCILYSIAFYKSPFDCELDGGSIALAVAAGRVRNLLSIFFMFGMGLWLVCSGLFCSHFILVHPPPLTLTIACLRVRGRLSTLRRTRTRTTFVP